MDSLICRSAALVPHRQGAGDAARHEIPRDIDYAGAYVPNFLEGVLEEIEFVGIALWAFVDYLLLGWLDIAVT